MKHASQEQLWALAQRELSAADQRAVEQHLTGCADCQGAFTHVRAAVEALTLMPVPPPLPPALARRVGSELEAELERREAKRLSSWWRFEWLTPRHALAFVASAALAVLLYAAVAKRVVEPQPEPIAMPTPVAPTPEVVPPVQPAPVPAAPPAAKLSVRVASASRAKSQGVALSKAQVLSEGQHVTTERGGALWLQLPDGSRAGLTGESDVQLATLEAKTLTLDIARGNLALVVPHKADRLLTVRAGDLEVKDLGTQFLVSREVARVVVAVEEGSVEVQVPGQTRTVRAGHAVAWHDGELDDLEWAPPPQPVKKQEHAGAPSSDGVTSVAKLAEEDDDAPPPALQPGASAEEEWAAPPSVAAAGQAGVTPEPGPAGAVVPQPQDVQHGTEVRLSLGAVEKRVNELTRQIHSPFPAVNTSMRSTEAKGISRLADSGDCDGVLVRVEQWLREPAAPPNEERTLRRIVLRQKLRCLTRQYRDVEAAQVRKELDGL